MKPVKCGMFHNSPMFATAMPAMTTMLDKQMMNAVSSIANSLAFPPSPIPRESFRSIDRTQVYQPAS